MPRYFFHIHNDAPSQEAQGLECTDDQAALELATDMCRDLASVAVRCGRLPLLHYVKVEEGAREVGLIRFAHAVRIVAE